MDKVFFDAEITAILDSRITPSDSVVIEGLLKIGTTKDLLTYLGCTRCSKIRLNQNGKPYFMVWGNGGTFYLPLAASLHKEDIESVSEVLDHPVYKNNVTFTDPTTGVETEGHTISIGVEQRTDIEDFDFTPVKPVAKAQPRVVKKP